MAESLTKIEEKWQDNWEKDKIFLAKDYSDKPKFYVLEMFPYPSGAGLHMGHAINFTISDIFARFKRMKGFNVLYPIGYDSLGLPAENAAIKDKTHPLDYTNKSIKNFKNQQKRLGFSYDTSRLINTCDPEYYKWDQWIFLKMYEKGIAYKKKSSVNYCPSCKTVLANEQSSGGVCERCKSKVQVKSLNQWFFKITDYSDRLLEGHNKLNWPEKTIAMQKNWIGKSHGTEIIFKLNGEDWPVFTTRPDTIFGVTFLVISANHERLFDFVTSDKKKEVEAFLKKINNVSEKELVDLEKEGVFTGSYAINPVNNEKVPLYVGNFVVADYGSGTVMAVPAHDQRDFDFAKKYKLDVREVIVPNRIDIQNPPVKGKVSKVRKNVHSIVYNPKTNKYLFLKSYEHKWITLPMGGVEDGEDIIEAAKREVIEETGYSNLKFTKVLFGTVRAEYFAKHKDENRVAFTNAVMFELVDEKRVPLAKGEDGKHEILWLDRKEIVYPKICHAELNDWLKNWDKNDSAFVDDGILINSGEFDGLENKEASEKITDWLIKRGIGKRKINYKLRDWGISRQRYWGTPIPIVYCDKCGVVPVPEKDLPVELPKEVKFGEGNPLETNSDWINTKCPQCKGKAKRETDTMDTFVNSSWYFLRYADPNNKKEIFDKKKVKYWCPTDLYIGGAEHACMHLIYARFYTMFLKDLGLIDFEEFAPRLFHQGMLHGPDGNKMSKSLGNTIDPLDIVKKYGADSLRLALMSFASPDKDTDWNEEVMIGSYKFVLKIINHFDRIKIGNNSKDMDYLLNKVISESESDIENFKYRNLVIKLRELFDKILSEKEVSKNTLESFFKMFSLYCPHISEEFWGKLGNKDYISLSKWPEADKSKLLRKESTINLTDKVIENLKILIERFEKTSGEIKKIYIYSVPNDLDKLDNSKIEKLFGKKVIIYSSSDKDKYDPENKAKKSKPFLPSIYFEN